YCPSGPQPEIQVQVALGHSPDGQSKPPLAVLHSQFGSCAFATKGFTSLSHKVVACVRGTTLVNARTESACLCSRTVNAVPSRALSSCIAVETPGLCAYASGVTSSRASAIS